MSTCRTNEYEGIDFNASSLAHTILQSTPLLTPLARSREIFRNLILKLKSFHLIRISIMFSHCSIRIKIFFVSFNKVKSWFAIEWNFRSQADEVLISEFYLSADIRNADIKDLKAKTYFKLLKSHVLHSAARVSSLSIVVTRWWEEIDIEKNRLRTSWNSNEMKVISASK
jgi:hypothetical protein